MQLWEKLIAYLVKSQFFTIIFQVQEQVATLSY